ncbi:MAG: alpha/beta hydrolase-fold protein [Candidatus Promineifilaceae bacterium]
MYVPAGYETSEACYPVLYLLHGRGDSMDAWTIVRSTLNQMIVDGEIPRAIVVMPDAPYSDRASYYVDSEYTGPGQPGRSVESAFINDLLPHLDTTYRQAGRAPRSRPSCVSWMAVTTGMCGCRRL